MASEAQPPLPEPRKSAALLRAEGAEKTFEIGNEEGKGVQPKWDESPIEVSCGCLARFDVVLMVLVFL